MPRYDLHNTLTTQVGALSSRSYYIPFENEAFSLDLRASRQVSLLSEWKFSYFPSISDEVFDCEPTDEIKAEGKRYYLNFDGVDCCYYVFVGGEFVGYSTVSHSHAEFDITDRLLVGENEIKVVVTKWARFPT